MPDTLTLLNGRLRVASCGGPLVLSPKPGTDKPCCCTCSCEKRKVHEWQQRGDEPYTFPEDVLCDPDYCNCEKFEVIARRTEPAYYGYPRVVASGGIKKTQLGTDETQCCIDVTNPFISHLPYKHYLIWHELWVMCAEKDDGTPESAI